MVGGRAGRLLEDRHLAEQFPRVQHVDVLLQLADDAHDLHPAGLDQVEGVARLVLAEDDVSLAEGLREPVEHGEVGGRGAHASPPSIVRRALRALRATGSSSPHAEDLLVEAPGLGRVALLLVRARRRRTSPRAGRGAWRLLHDRREGLDAAVVLLQVEQARAPSRTRPWPRIPASAAVEHAS